ncbi:MAG: PAS domain S-box protein [Phycisphaerae bacterium]|nr:PAS domain S-box protein [Phycisphaerae bacterium]
MSVPAMCNLLALVGVVVAGVFVLRVPRRVLRGDAKMVLAVMLGLMAFHYVSNTLEWSGITKKLDAVEDYFEILVPLVWIFFLYVFLQDVAESDLRQSEEQQRALLQSMQEVVIYHDNDMRIVWANRAAAESAGMRREELPGKACHDVWNDSDVPCEECPVVAVQCTGKPAQGQQTTADGRIWHIRAAPVQDDSGEMIGMVEVASDVTAERKAERALRDSEQRFRQLAEMLPGIVFEMEPNGQLTFANRNAFAMLNRSYEDFQRGISAFDLVAPADRKRAIEDARAAMVGGPTGPFEYLLQRGDGTTFPAVVCGAPIRRDDRITGLRGIATDISRHRQAARELQRERDFSRSLVQASPAFFVAIDSEGKTLMMNEAMLQALDYTSEQVVGKPYLDTFVPDEDHDAVSEMFQTLLTTNRSVVHENRILTRDGSQRLVEWHGRQVFGVSDQPEYFFGVGIDVTERRRVEEQLRQAQRLEAVGRLAAGIAHDFNNQLSVVKGYCDLLMGGPLDDKKAVSEGLREIERASHRAAKLTGQLLAYSRQQVLRPEIVDLNEVLRDMTNPLQRMIGEDVRLSVVTDPSAGRVRVDPARLQQAVMNLATNARDAMPDGGELHLEVANADMDAEFYRRHRDVTAGSHVMLIVQDTGVGMPPDQLTAIFEPFYTTKEVGKGTGLGLSMVYGFVKQSGGHVVVRSAPGHGTVVRLILPRVDEAAETPDPPSDTPQRQDASQPAGAAPSRPSMPRQANASAAEKAPRRLLVVEDEPAVRGILVHMLRDGGYDVIEAESPNEALQTIRDDSIRVDLLITDVVMPEISGPQLAERVREIDRNRRENDDAAGERPPLNVLYVSGYPDGRCQSSEAPAFGEDARVVAKPIDYDELLQAVRDLLDAAGEQR